MFEIKDKIKQIISEGLKPATYNPLFVKENDIVDALTQLLTTEIDARFNSIEQETEVKLLASINSFLTEQGIKDTDGTPLTFSPERF